MKTTVQMNWIVSITIGAVLLAADPGWAAEPSQDTRVNRSSTATAEPEEIPTPRAKVVRPDNIKQGSAVDSGTHGLGGNMPVPEDEQIIIVIPGTEGQKLTIGSPDDGYEQEADAIAGQIGNPPSGIATDQNAATGLALPGGDVSGLNPIDDPADPVSGLLSPGSKAGIDPEDNPVDPVSSNRMRMPAQKVGLDPEDDPGGPVSHGAQQQTKSGPAPLTGVEVSSGLLKSGSAPGRTDGVKGSGMANMYPLGSTDDTHTNDQPASPPGSDATSEQKGQGGQLIDSVLERGQKSGYSFPRDPREDRWTTTPGDTPDNDKSDQAKSRVVIGDNSRKKPIPIEARGKLNPSFKLNIFTRNSTLKEGDKVTASIKFTNQGPGASSASTSFSLSCEKTCPFDKTTGKIGKSLKPGRSTSLSLTSKALSAGMYRIRVRTDQFGGDDQLNLKVTAKPKRAARN